MGKLTFGSTGMSYQPKNVRFNTASPVCPRCNMKVFFNEEKRALGQVWHTRCFSCVRCKKSLDSTSCNSNENELYCNSCHKRLFGPNGYGFAGGAAGLSTDASQYRPTKPPKPTLTEAGKIATPTPPQDSGSDVEGAEVAGAAAPRKPPHIDRDDPACCPRCGRDVYLAEEVMAVSRKWHKLCFNCGECHRALDVGQLNENGGDIYCKACYGRRFGPRGYGYASGAGNMLASEAEKPRARSSSSPPAFNQNPVRGEVTRPIAGNVIFGGAGNVVSSDADTTYRSMNPSCNPPTFTQGLVRSEITRPIAEHVIFGGTENMASDDVEKPQMYTKPPAPPPTFTQGLVRSEATRPIAGNVIFSSKGPRPSRSPSTELPPLSSTEPPVIPESARQPELEESVPPRQTYTMPSYQADRVDEIMTEEPRAQLRPKIVPPVAPVQYKPIYEPEAEPLRALHPLNSPYGRSDEIVEEPLPTLHIQPKHADFMKRMAHDEDPHIARLAQAGEGSQIQLTSAPYEPSLTKAPSSVTESPGFIMDAMQGITISSPSGESFTVELNNSAEATRLAASESKERYAAQRAAQQAAEMAVKQAYEDARISPEPMRRSPHEMRYSPQDNYRSPQELGRYPQDMRYHSQHERRSPQDLLYSPNQDGRFSQEMRRSPQEMRRSSQEMRRSPQEMRHSPHEMGRSPHEMRRSPQEMRRSPQNMRRSPQEMRRSPQNMRRSPQEMRRSPQDMPYSTQHDRRSPQEFDRIRDDIRQPSSQQDVRSPHQHQMAPSSDFLFSNMYGAPRAEAAGHAKRPSDCSSDLDAGYSSDSLPTNPALHPVRDIHSVAMQNASSHHNGPYSNLPASPSGYTDPVYL